MIDSCNYAWNRFYSATWGRFSSPDPYVMSGGLTHPQGWNRYSYVENDPVNLTDKTGLHLDQCADPEEAAINPYCLLRKDDARPYIFAAVVPHPEGGLQGVWLTGWVRLAPPVKPTPKTWDPKSLLPGMRSRAIDGATAILKTNGDCARIYGINGIGLGPVELLQKLAAGDTEYGAIEYGSIKDPKVSAMTVRLIVEPESTIKGGALITLNDNTGSNWFLGDEDDRVLTILHELAHAYDIIYGHGSSALPANEVEDGISRQEQTRRSMQNSAFVRKQCFP